MPALPDNDVTFWLGRARAGDRDAQEQLYRRVKENLRTLAAACLAHQPPGRDLQVTMLVDDAFCQLVVEGERTPANRREFYSWASRVMYQKLVDRVRQDAAAKRGGRPPVSGGEWLAGLPDERPAPDGADPVALQDALQEWAKVDPQGSAILHLILADASPEEITGRLGISLTTYKRRLRFARAWWREKLVR
jgi:RNA polymerase sigma factor (TIGR02999 family)